MSKVEFDFNIHFRPDVIKWMNFMRQPGIDKVWSRKRVFHIPFHANTGWLEICNVPMLYPFSVRNLISCKNRRETGRVGTDLRDRFPTPLLFEGEFGPLKPGFHFKEFVH